MLTLHNIAYTHPNKTLLFSNIGFTVNTHNKIALIGNNGSGKSTLLGICAGRLQPSAGQLTLDSQPYYVPQIFGQYNHLTVAQALGVEEKLNALEAILNGDVTENNFAIVDNDWTIEDRCLHALNQWQLGSLSLTQKLATLSGGQKTKVFLAGISIYEPQLILLDEPSNHLDTEARQLLYNFIQTTSSTLLVVSHDRQLLNLLDKVYQLNKTGITMYGGNYDFYAEQKQLENNALNQHLQSAEKALRKAKEKQRETVQRQQKLDARGKNKQEKAGVARIMMNTLRNSAENSTAKIKNAHAEKIGSISQSLQELRLSLPDIDRMKIHFDNPALHTGKILFKATGINFGYGNQPLWPQNLTLEIASGERIALKGPNGSGKTTLIKILLQVLEPQTGTVYRAHNKPVYIDQDYSLINHQLTVYQQALQFNHTALQEHEIKINLTRFLFAQTDWDKPCSALSGGERMRLVLCCLAIGHQWPDIIFMDEPTNNLDIQNIEILTAAIHEYKGTLIIVSHDEYFLNQTNIQRVIQL